MATLSISRAREGAVALLGHCDGCDERVCLYDMTLPLLFWPFMANAYDIDVPGSYYCAGCAAGVRTVEVE